MTSPKSKEQVAPEGGWRPISEFEPSHPMQQVLCGHSEKKWIRFGFRETILKRWYYSGTNERSQWSQIEGDAPTHFMPLPTPPKGGEE